MATSWSSTYTFSGSSTKSHGSYNATMECEGGWEWKNNEDNTAIQYAAYARARYSSANATGYGVRTRVYIGSELGTATGVLSYGTWVADTGWKYSSWIQRTHETQTVEIWAKAAGETVSGYGAAPEDTGWFKYTDYIGPLASWTVAYDANGGSGAPASQTKWLGETLALSSSTPSWEGRTFNGWNTKADGTGTNYAAGASYTANEGATLYAKWTKNTYQVKFDANGGTGAPSTQTKTHGTSLTISATKPTRTNYKFLGWATSASATSAQYRTGTNNDQNTAYTTDAPITLYAVWELAYTPPRITNLKCYRCDDSGTAADEGTRCYVSFTYTTDTNISSTNYATVTAKVGSNTATTLVAASAKKAGTNTYAGVLADTGLDVNSTYAVVITVSDVQGGSTTASTVLSQAFFTMDFKSGGHGVSIGKPATTVDLFDVGMATKFDKGIGAIDTRGSDHGVSWMDKSLGVFFSNNPLPSGIATWMSGIAIKGWTGDYTAWELVGPAGSSNQTTKPLYVRAGRPTNGWGAWRQIYDSTNKPALTDLSGTLAIGHGGTGATTAANALKNIMAGKTVLYNNTSGTTGTVTLSQTAANFDHMRIYYKSGRSSTEYSAVDVYSPNGKIASLHMMVIDSGYAYHYWKMATISGTSITQSSGYGWYGSNASAAVADESQNNVYITRVEAWNEA